MSLGDRSIRKVANAWLPPSGPDPVTLSRSHYGAARGGPHLERCRDLGAGEPDSGDAAGHGLPEAEPGRPGPGRQIGAKGWPNGVVSAGDASYHL